MIAELLGGTGVRSANKSSAGTVRLTSLLPSRLAVGERKTKVPAWSSWLIIDE